MPTAGPGDLPEQEIAPGYASRFAEGRVVVDYGDRKETTEAGQAYSIAPGHLVKFPEDAEALEVTPTDALERTFEAVRRNAGGPG
jgi:hypothetical protein